MATREALRLIDSEPVLDAELLSLGRWISGYYCAPLGDVLRGMLPLAGPKSAAAKSGRSPIPAATPRASCSLDRPRPTTPARILAHARKAPALGRYLARILPLADKAIAFARARGFIAAEDVQTERDPLRAPSARLRVELASKCGQTPAPETPISASTS
jgi:primosomal protein N' (replication factor Y)